MRDRWYGDNRDLIKWGGIKILCGNEINKVLWIAYLREDTWTQIRFDDGQAAVSVPKEVIDHFKSIRHNMSQLRENIGLDIILVDDKIDEKYSHRNRINYKKSICRYIKNNDGGNKVVFLDPDTGLEPNILNETHVSKGEVEEIWESLKAGDYLVFYQHKSYDDGWRERRRKELADICKSKGGIKMWYADVPMNNDFAKLARDVVFYFIKKDLSA